MLQKTIGWGNVAAEEFDSAVDFPEKWIEWALYLDNGTWDLYRWDWAAYVPTSPDNQTAEEVPYNHAWAAFSNTKEALDTNTDSLLRQTAWLDIPNTRFKKIVGEFINDTTFPESKPYFYGGYVYYAGDWNSNNNLFRIDLSTGVLEQLWTDRGQYLVSNGMYLFYKNYDTGILMRADMDWANSTQIFSNYVGYLTEENGYVFFRDNATGYLYRVDSDWSNPTQMTTTSTYDTRSCNGYVFYKNNSDWNKIYGMYTDWSNIRQITDEAADPKACYGGWLYYRSNSTNTIHKADFWWMDFDLWINAYNIVANNTHVLYFDQDNNNYLTRANQDWTNSEVIAQVNGWYMSWNFDDSYEGLYFKMWNWTEGFMKIDPDDPKGFAGTDWTYSGQLELSSDKFAIDLVYTAPTGTSVSLELANEKTISEVIPEWNFNMDVCCARYTDMSWSNSFTTMFSAGQTVTLFKTGYDDQEVVITSVPNDNEFYFSPDVFCCTGGVWVRAEQASFHSVDVLEANGKIPFTQTEEFGSVQDTLYYNLSVSSTDLTKTAVINSVEVLK